MKSIWIAVLGGLLLTAEYSLASESIPSPEGDLDAGKKLAGQCRTCHGLDGVARIAIAPHIGGESAQYISNQLHAFHDGTRVQEMMSLVVQGLDAQKISDLAAWYSSLQPEVSLKADAAEAPSACVDCHGADGLAINPDAPHLAGESTIYIDKQLKDFRSGKRQSAVMQAIAESLSDEDIRSAAEWYAAIEFTTHQAEQDF